jgi:hypothetical protein
MHPRNDGAGMRSVSSRGILAVALSPRVRYFPGALSQKPRGNTNRAVKNPAPSAGQKDKEHENLLPVVFRRAEECWDTRTFLPLDPTTVPSKTGGI